MANKLIGIEIGTDTVKMAVCNGKAIKTMAVERMPENFINDNKITAPAAMANFLKKMCRSYGIRPGACALVLPQADVISHKISMPVMTEEQLLVNLPFEFRDFVGKDGEKYEYDYVVTDVTDNIMQIYAAAVRKDTIAQYDAVLRKAGLNLKAAMPAELAWLNLIRNTKNAPNSICIMDLGHITTRVDIFANGHFEMGKDIEIAGQSLIQAIAASQRIDPFVARTRKEANMDNVLQSDVCNEIYNAISVEVMRILNFYLSSADGAKLGDLYYCGGSSANEALRIAILKRTNLTMHHIRRLVPADDSMSDNLVAYCALAAGGALQLL